MSLSNILTISLTLFAVIDMIGNIPLIIKLRTKYGEVESFKATVISTVIMITTLFVGGYLFKLLNINISHFAMAGALLILYFGAQMVIGVNHETEMKQASKATVFPVAFPLISGAGTLSTIMSFKAQFTNSEIIIGILVNSVVIYVVLKTSNFVENKLGYNGLIIIERVFGILLVSIGIKMFIENLIISLELIQNTK